VQEEAGTIRVDGGDGVEVRAFGSGGHGGLGGRAMTGSPVMA
jgi:hypothetical protein